MAISSFLRNELYDRDPLWQAQLSMVVALVLQIILPDKYVAGPKYLLITLEALLLLTLFITTPPEPIFRSLKRRLNVVALIGLVGVGNIVALQRVASQLLAGGRIANGHELILASINIFLTNVIIFGLLYWELDGGGPGHRREAPLAHRDFLFPQMASPEAAPKGWMPGYFDYLYLSTTNATAFSPTDTMPLSHRAKVLMLVQSLVSLITIALVAARAVNILS